MIQTQKKPFWGVRGSEHDAPIIAAPHTVRNIFQCLALHRLTGCLKLLLGCLCFAEDKSLRGLVGI